MLNHAAAKRIRARGAYVWLVGPDGTGKSTVAAALVDALGGLAQHRHWRPGLLRAPGEILGKPVTGINTDPHGREPQAILKATARVLYYFADFVAGYWLVVRPALAHHDAFVIERGWQDLVVDPRRYLLPGSGLPRALARLVPRPDVTIILDVPGEVAVARKPELTAAEVRRQLTMWPVAARSTAATVVLDATLPPDVLAAEVVRGVAALRAGRRWPMSNTQRSVLEGV